MLLDALEVVVVGLALLLLLLVIVLIVLIVLVLPFVVSDCSCMSSTVRVPIGSDVM